MKRNGYQRSLDYLYGLEKFGMIFGLKKIEEILEAIGDPHRDLQAIHIGGTNGKGSTAAMIASILQKEGYRVGLYTSPHLIRFTERIRINGEEIEPEKVAELTEYLQERIEAAGISPPFTFFDFTTALAFLYFREKVVDLVVLEVGLGGRLDSTNVIDPLISVITNIGKDHEDVLGRGIMKIAAEKAGIIKKGRPLVTAATQPRVIGLFSRICREKGAPFFRVGKEFRYAPSEEKTFHYEGLHRKLWNLSLNLYGPHQMVNATTAIGAMEILDDLGFRVTNEAIVEGLKTVQWPGRLEMIHTHPRVILDGAHNPEGALSLRAALERDFSYHRLILLVGIMKDKDIPAILTPLVPMADHVILTRPSIERAASPQTLRKAMGRNGERAELVDDLKEAIERGLSLMDEDDLLCITGSLYTVGEARSYFLCRGGS